MFLSLTSVCSELGFINDVPRMSNNIHHHASGSESNTCSCLDVTGAMHKDCLHGIWDTRIWRQIRWWSLRLIEPVRLIVRSSIEMRWDEMNFVPLAILMYWVCASTASHYWCTCDRHSSVDQCLDLPAACCERAKHSRFEQPSAVRLRLKEGWKCFARIPLLPMSVDVSGDLEMGPWDD